MANLNIHRIDELETLVAHLHQREKWLRAVLSSALTSHESRTNAREELESLLDKSEEAEDELMLLASPAGVEEHQKKSSVQRPHCCRQERFILRCRFGRGLDPQCSARSSADQSGRA
jgi:hypothetical protein